MIAVPRWLLVGLGALFSGYHVVLGITSLDVPASPVPTLVALALYAFATVISLWPAKQMRMPQWMAVFDVAVAVALPLLVTSQLDPLGSSGYATWYVAAVGTLMTIVAARRQLLVAWTGVIVLAVQTLAWAGPMALGTLGVIGSIVWVGITHMLTAALAKAVRDTRAFGRAEREAADWQAAQDAHLFEGRLRIAQTSRIAAPMLRRIIERGGDLTEAQRRECRMLEAAIRDEIRGRMLLDDDVRERVREARERGAVVSLLDEGGIDELSDEARGEVLSQLADAIAASRADRIVARTAASGGPTAVTVVGLLAAAPGATVDEDDDEVEFWLEIPRVSPERASGG
ncbi:hypothetical protein [Agromyces sp. SYSU T00194]|uniref:hypothetical protein n=1 Tax=Agromyces chitinivorans TaxID=3158560 RepID=UPI0033957199